jgi:hypothetical protein
MDDGTNLKKTQLLKSIRQFKPSATVFEVGKFPKSAAIEVMKSKRAEHEKAIQSMKQHNTALTKIKSSEEEEEEEVSSHLDLEPTTERELQVN